MQGRRRRMAPLLGARRLRRFGRRADDVLRGVLGIRVHPPSIILVRDTASTVCGAASVRTFRRLLRSSAGYLLAQLSGFPSGLRPHPRGADFASGLSAEEQQAVADYVSRLAYLSAVNAL